MLILVKYLYFREIIYFCSRTDINEFLFLLINVHVKGNIFFNELHETAMSLKLVKCPFLSNFFIRSFSINLKLYFCCIGKYDITSVYWISFRLQDLKFCLKLSKTLVMTCWHFLNVSSCVNYILNETKTIWHFEVMFLRETLILLSVLPVGIFAVVNMLQTADRTVFIVSTNWISAVSSKLDWDIDPIKIVEF